MNSSESVELSIVIPAYNEELRLPPTLRESLEFLRSHPYRWELLVANDGSTDRTAAVVREFQTIDPRISLLDNSRNVGKGHAVRRGMLAARGARRLFMDADGSTSLSEVTRLMAALDQGADISFGSRALESAEVTIDARWYRRYPGRIFNWCVNNILSLGFADTQCGFKLFTANAADQVFGKQESLQFGFDLELLYVGQRLGLKLTEVPVNWRNVPGSKVRVIRDGLRMLQDAFSIRARHQSLTR